MAKKDQPSGPATIQNRKARHDYEILDTVEAGLVLVGSEVKSLFAGKANLTDAYCKIDGGELWVVNLDITTYDKATTYAPDPRRTRKLLMHRQEIDLLHRKSQEKGLTMIPLKIYFKNGRAKIEVGLARGRKQYDKRDALAKKDQKREMDRLRSRQDF